MMNTELEWPYRVGCLVCSAEIDATSSNAVCDSCRSDAALGRAGR
jgi:Zn finger protein HypA/HybF involved in hydrogenase expression